MIQRAIGIMLIAGCVSVPAWAHHSNAAYDRNNVVQIVGTVTTVKWTNPHMFVELAVPTADGKTETWELELGSTGAEAATGLSQKNLKPGAKIKVYANRHHDPAVLRANVSVIEIDGKIYGRNANDKALVP